MNIVKQTIEENSRWWNGKVKRHVDAWAKGRSWRRCCMPISAYTHTLLKRICVEAFLKRMRDRNQKGIKTLVFATEYETRWVQPWSREHQAMVNAIVKAIDEFLLRSENGESTGKEFLHDEIKVYIRNHKELAKIDSGLVIEKYLIEKLNAFMECTKTSDYFVRAERKKRPAITLYDDLGITQPEFGF